MKKYIISFLAISIILLSSIALFSSCATQKRCQQLYPSTTNNTETVKVEKQVVYKDTTIYRTLPTDTIRVEQKVLIPVPDLPTIKAENKYCIAQSWVSEGIQFLNLTIKPVKLEFTAQNKIETLKIEDSKVKEIIISKPYIPKVYKWALNIVLVEILMFFLWLLYKFRNVLTRKL